MFSSSIREILSYLNSTAATNVRCVNARTAGKVTPVNTSWESAFVVLGFCLGLGFFRRGLGVVIFFISPLLFVRFWLGCLTKLLLIFASWGNGCWGSWGQQATQYRLWLKWLRTSIPFWTQMSLPLPINWRLGSIICWLFAMETEEPWSQETLQVRSHYS